MHPSESARALSRFERVLKYIHDHLHEPLSVPVLAECGGWSRWQLQRIFADCTGLSVAQYVRELRLSQAAEALLMTRRRQLDIALTYGFQSEISFSRSFKQLFGCSPGVYRQRGRRSGLRTPLPVDIGALPPAELLPRFPQIRIEWRPAFEVVGLPAEIGGLFSTSPDFSATVPRLWRSLHDGMGGLHGLPLIGVLDTRKSAEAEGTLIYWAGIERHLAANAEHLERLRVPAQEYAVISFCGPLPALAEAVLWVIEHWLPRSAYRGHYGYDLELYPPGFAPASRHCRMEYWIPVEPTLTAR